jgi:hypothetical protein
MKVKIWKETVMAYLNLLLLHLPGKNKDIHDSLSQDQLTELIK